MIERPVIADESTPVLLVSPSAKPGGAERALVSLATGLLSVGFRPTVVLLEHGPVEQWFIDAGAGVVVLPAGRAREVATLARTVWRLRSMINDLGAQAVVSNMAKGHLYGGLAATAARVPSVWWQQGIPERANFEVAAAMVPSAAVVASCESAVEAQRRLTPRRKILRLHLGIDVDLVSSRRGSGTDVRRQLGWQHNTIVGIVGRLEPWKGQDIFLQAAAIVSKGFPDARFLVVGGAVLGWEGDYPERLEALGRNLGLDDKVRFTGHRPDVYPWFDALDVVVHASVGEPFGLVLVEAMALGKPLVATADGGPTEIVEDGVSGLLVAPGNVEALAEGVTRVLADPALAKRLADGGSRRAPQFSEQTMAAGMADILHDVLRDGFAVGPPRASVVGRLWGRPLLTGQAVIHEVAGAVRLAQGRTLARYAADILLYRVMRVTKLPSTNAERFLRLKGGIELVYRLNRGDIQGIREVWIDEAYRLPFSFEPTVVIDLGANIGLTSVFFAKRYRCRHVVAVEPDPSNARLTRLNLARNGVRGEVVEAAAGAADREGHFTSHEESNLGRLTGDGGGQPVQILSMESLLARTPHGVADLVKVDIEGGEGALLGGDLSWTKRVGALIVEFHPTLVDYPHLVRRLEETGFRYVPANSAWPGSMDAFVRHDWSTCGAR